MNGELYGEILTENLFPNASELLGKSWIFQQDNDPKYTAKITKEWFDDNNIKILDWSTQLPDLNPIEHLWEEVDRRLRILPVKVSNKDQL